MTSTLTKEASVCISKPQLQELIDRLKAEQYRTIGPRISQDAIIYDDVDSISQLPIGYRDTQDGGYYRLEKCGDAWFDYVVGPHSLKNFLFPPRETLVQLERVNSTWKMSVPHPAPQALAIIGPRSCDLHAMEIQDRVFLGEVYTDSAYQKRREKLFLVAVNCRRAAATCFCHSMNAGPKCTRGYDLVLTELDEHFIVEIGSLRGGEMMRAIAWKPCTARQLDESRRTLGDLATNMRSRESNTSLPEPGAPKNRALDTTDLHQLLMDHLEHDRWDQVAKRCLACANCTMVCPTCFCNSVEDVSDLSGDRVQRVRAWDSCFTMEHSRMSTGAVRKSIASRYRQWLTHKLATWHDHFQIPGCVGCGRCITWCPVGIDLTEEVAAIRKRAI
ncbi:MAG: 4Fe-4S dicluster domain-containing protein [Planctomycetales bacterium]|nr:4Fe-4S dicluster domain-containing protein [Planctomycetales bacterium]